MNPEKLDVVAIGNAIVDVLINTEESFLREHSLAKGNMTLITQEKAEELYSKSDPSLETSGGSAANTIAGLSELGSNAEFIGRVKKDALGNTFKDDICSTGAVFNTPPIKYGPSTARCFIYVTPDAERTMCTYLGASVLLETKDIDFSILGETKILYLEGYLWDLEKAKSALKASAEECKKLGGKIALSLSDSFCIERHRESFQELLEKNIDILFANENEIISLYNSSSLDDAIENIKPKCEIAVITIGGKGSIIISGDEKYLIKPYNFGKVIDTTGAGDLYASGFLHGYVNGLDLQTCGNIGSTCAGYIVSQLGSRSKVSLKDIVIERLGLPA
ncbi:MULTISPECIES: adenosine kinase [Prochlorococcus]|uniref:Sugar kinase, ribokinase family n=1 Tax=Prochlorococcus marinus (strain SARG / CCMP1375 / SS120) TaxID=167539 RepID=Q7VD78_PROMA|nr:MULTISPECIES: adenosine kinase [Prochlorococcus]AAP99550.1 Sugar kinase, ribokinase family [Prochlorococcus marinus subsp. marinus str. CCMP1375]KGG11177.1 Fructokinase [Prochlorococcus marinus str. LG]KGG21515.1 Fructokinase [Prochlorococcus marinus str. SS2]KGG23140.1 Fructokinase [Prochlorococcus marinus str. SS35]KGG33851.1 Fructokinase [Prochlorococcus marinus str. SS51]